MFCIKCHSQNTKVINSRPHKKRATIWRRRHCLDCGATFTTMESVATEGLLTIDQQGSTTPFSIGRLLLSIAPLLTQRDTAPDDAYWLAMTAYEKALALQNPTVTSEDLASIVYRTIERFDSTAALKYALDHGLTHLPTSRARRPKHG